MTLYDDLHDLMKPPALYERTGEPFWDDEHISRGMLAAHLDPEFEGASRSFAFMDRSVAWIARVAPPAAHPRLLDLGCGPGLYAERFARAGFEVTGVDLSRRSIEHARESARGQGLAIDYRCQDYLALDLDATFDAAVMIYCDYGALSADERRAVLQRIQGRLRPGAALVLDVFSRRFLEAFEERSSWEHHANGGYWNPGPHIEIQRSRAFPDEAATLEQIAVVAPEGAKTYHLWNTCFTRETLASELEAAGFRAEGFFADAAGAPFDEESPTICAVARAGFRPAGTGDDTNRVLPEHRGFAILGA